MFKLSVILYVIAFVAISAFLVVIGTPLLHEPLMSPLDRVPAQVEGALKGEMVNAASELVETAASLTADPKVRASFDLQDLSQTKEVAALLLSQAGGARGTAPDVAALIDPEGNVRVRAGKTEGLGDNLAGLPVIKESLSGVALDGVVSLKGSFHVAAHPIYKDNKIIGTVMVGKAIDARFLARANKSTQVPLALVVDDKVLGAIDGMSASEIKGILGVEQVGVVETGLPDVIPLPLGVESKQRYLVGKVDVLRGTDARWVYAVDRAPAMKALAMGQVGLIGTMLALTLLMLFALWRTVASINKPMNMILEHLGKYAQGQATGVLPVGAMKGPFSRLGKQINMILESPPVGQPRAGTAPIAPPSSSAGSSADILPSLPTTSPSDDAGLQPVSSAIVSDALQNSALSGLFDETQTSARPPTPPPSPSQSGPMPESPPPAAAPPVAAPPVSPSAAYNHESTVLTPTSDLLIKASSDVAPPAASPFDGLPPGLPPDDGDSATVVGQIPPELLQHSRELDAEKSQNEEEAHYRQVYEEFLSTRQQCGEDTSSLTYERFVAKLMKNRKQIVEKYNSKSVRFQVYVKNGKAALRAVPVKE